MATLTAGQNSIFKGFAAAGNAIGLPAFGSFDVAPFAGVTTQYIYTTDGTSGSIGLTGNQSPSFFGGQIYVDGVAWAVSYTTYDGTHTSYSLTPANGTGFVNATNYNVSLTSAPVNPNITSAATVINLVNTTLAHTITADKTIASTAIIGGANAAAFEINGTNQLRFASNAASSALGSLVVDIEITDTDGLTDTQTITVPVKAIVFKAIKFYSRAGSTATAPVLLTGFSNPLTGENNIAAAIGDTIVAFPAIGSNADRDMILNSGYAEHADHYVNGTTYDANIGLFTKTLTAAETSATIGSSGSANDAQAMILMLFQGVDPASPMDVSVVLDQGTGTGKPNPAAITPVTPGAVAIFGGAQAAATAVALTSSDLTAFTQRVQADTNDIGVGAGFIEWLGSGPIDPAVFGGGSSNAANSWATISAVLKPAWVASGGTDALTGNSMASGAAAIGQGTISIAHLLAGTALATGAAAVGVASLTQAHGLTGAAIATSAAALGVPTLNQVHGLAGTGVTTSAASIGTSAIAIVTLLVGNGLATSAAAIGAGAIGQAHALTGLSVSTGAASAGSPALAQVHGLIAVSVATSAAVLGSPTLAQAHPVAGSPISTSSAQIGIGSMTQSYSLVAQTIATGAASVGGGLLVQIHGLGGDGVATAAAVLGQGTVQSASILSGNSLATGPASVGIGALAQRHVVGGVSISTGPASAGVGAMSQAHVVSGVAVATGAAAIGAGAINQVIALSGLGLATGPAAIGFGDLGQTHGLVGVSLSTGAAEIGIGSISLSGTLMPNPISTGPASIGIGNVRRWEWHETPLVRRSASLPQIRISVSAAQPRASASLAQPRSSFSPEQIRATSSVEQRRASASPAQPRKSG